MGRQEETENASLRLHPNIESLFVDLRVQLAVLAPFPAKMALGNACVGLLLFTTFLGHACSFP